MEEFSKHQLVVGYVHEVFVRSADAGVDHLLFKILITEVLFAHFFIVVGTVTYYVMLSLLVDEVLGSGTIFF